MYELKVNHNICNGYMSCGLCNDHIPGFLTKQHGHLLISEYFLNKNNETITAAVEDCPTLALTLEVVEWVEDVCKNQCVKLC